MTLTIDRPCISLKACRANAGLSQRELAEKLDVSPTTVISWENGTTVPNYNTVQKISDLSGVPLQLIFLPR